MKRTLLSVRELAEALGISADSVYRAYRRARSQPRKSTG